LKLKPLNDGVLGNDNEELEIDDSTPPVLDKTVSCSNFEALASFFTVRTISLNKLTREQEQRSLARLRLHQMSVCLLQQARCVQFYYLYTVTKQPGGKCKSAEEDQEDEHPQADNPSMLHTKERMSAEERAEVRVKAT
jgi:hypothetical protein